jgi:exosortase
MTGVRSNLSFAFLCVVSLAVGWHPLARTLSLTLHNDEYTPLLLILPVSAALILLDWRSRSQKPIAQANFRIGSALLLAAVLIAGLARWRAADIPDDVQLSLSMLALVLWWIASFVACFGTQTSRTLLFPLVFLLWMVPIPSFALNKVVEFLQAESAVAARLMFSLIGVPVSQQGFVLAIPGVNIEVARECSSVRSSVMLLIASMVLSQVSLRSPWSKAVVIAATVPLSIAKNALRIVTLSMLGTRLDPGFLTGRLHHQGGIVFFMISLAVLVLLLWILRRAEERRVPLELNPLKLQQFHLQDRN